MAKHILVGRKKWLAAVIAAIVLLSIMAGVLLIHPASPSTNVSVKAIDSANTVTDPTWFKRVYKAGFRLYVMHSTAWDTCNPWENTESQLKMALDAGLKIAVYTRDPRCWKAGIEAAGPYVSQLQFFALDVEDEPGVPGTRAMVDGITASGVRPVIYTGFSMWPSIQKESGDAFKDVPLWDTNTSQFAYENWKADYLSPLPVMYAGWNTSENMRIGVQQQFEYKLFDVYVDLNSFDSRFLN